MTLIIDNPQTTENPVSVVPYTGITQPGQGLAIPEFQGCLIKSGDELISAFLQEYPNPETRRNKKRSIETFAKFLNTNPGTAIEVLISAGLGRANQLVSQFVKDLAGNDDSPICPASINHHITCMRSIVKLARRFGICNWFLEIKSMKTAGAYTNTAGPGFDVIKGMFALLKSRSDKISIRNYAVLMLLWTLGLRRAEISSLDLEHFNPANRTLSIMGKGRVKREDLILPDIAIAAVQNWLTVRPNIEHKALFTNFDRSQKNGPRMQSQTTYLMVRNLGRELGIEKLAPHMIRHASITNALDIFNGDVRKVRKFSRHKSVETILIYDDNRNSIDFQKDISLALAESLNQESTT
ncbi:tyrosine-type recombinase/integrase [Candidatus Pacearchaeota archaeon]|nr:tyrosine-type recombinase/integrase [Candidatus Pacearchaeota archaeon]